MAELTEEEKAEKRRLDELKKNRALIKGFKEVYPDASDDLVKAWIKNRYIEHGDNATTEAVQTPGNLFGTATGELKANGSYFRKRNDALVSVRDNTLNAFMNSEFNVKADGTQLIDPNDYNTKALRNTYSYGDIQDADETKKAAAVYARQKMYDFQNNHNKKENLAIQYLGDTKYAPIAGGIGAVHTTVTNFGGNQAFLQPIIDYAAAAGFDEDHLDEFVATLDDEKESSKFSAQIYKDTGKTVKQLNSQAAKGGYAFRNSTINPGANATMKSQAEARGDKFLSDVYTDEMLQEAEDVNQLESTGAGLNDVMTNDAANTVLQGLNTNFSGPTVENAKASTKTDSDKPNMLQRALKFITGQRGSSEDNFDGGESSPEFAEGGEIGQGAQSQSQSQPIDNSGADRAKKIIKDFEGLNSTIDKETRDELLKRIYDEQEAKKAQRSQQRDPNTLALGGQPSFTGSGSSSNSNVAAGGPGGVVDAVGTGIGMLSDLFGATQDLSGSQGDGDMARAVGATAKTAGSLVGGAIEVPEGTQAIGELDGNKWSGEDSPYYKPKEKSDYGESYGAYAAGGNMGMFLKAGAGLAQGFNDLGAVGKQYSAQQIGETAGYETLNLDPIKNSIKQQMGASRYRAESGATNWGDMLQVNNAISAQGTRQLNDAAIQKQQYDMSARSDYNARKRADLIQQNAYDATAEMQTDKAGAVADETSRGALNQMLNTSAGVGQDLINKGLAEDIGNSADKEASALAYAQLFGKAEGGQISGDSDVIQGMKEKGYSDQLINRILNQ